MPPVAWKGGTTDYPRDTPVHRLFEAQAAATPDTIALVTAAGYLTYSQLNSRANNLAVLLLRRGIQRNAPCLLYTSRCV